MYFSENNFCVSRVSLSTLLGFKCGSQEHQCDEKVCITKQWVCDGEPDCIDGSDEAGCEATRMPKPFKRSTSPINPTVSSSIAEDPDEPIEVTTEFQTEIPITLTTLKKSTKDSMLPSELQMNCILKCSNK